MANATIGPRALSVQELADAWGVHPNTIRKYIRDGALKAFRIDRKVLITMESIVAVENSTLAGTPRKQYGWPL